MARAFPTNNAVTNAVAANTLIALCMIGISCVEWPDQTGLATYGLVCCLDVRIATMGGGGPPDSKSDSLKRFIGLASPRSPAGG